MSLLAPLYLAALAALSVPLVLHLIRRTPQGRRAFSSLMFLSPSPPRLTRRSRIDHWLLLLLRAAALILLALAFSRPFLRRLEQIDLGAGNQRRTVIALDASASMRRQGLWKQAIDKARGFVDDSRPGDVVSLLVYSDKPIWLATLDEVGRTTPSRRRSLLNSRLTQARPGWGGGDLGAALVAAADSLDSLDAQRRGDKPSDERLEIVVISDMAEGSRLAALEAYDWPQRVRVLVEPVTTDGGNAGLHLASSTSAAEQAPSSPAGNSGPAGSSPAGEKPVAGRLSKVRETVRVRVTSAADSDRDQFVVRWGSAKGVSRSQAAKVHVAPGESRVVALRRPAGNFDRLVLEGDDQPFDNRVFLPPLAPPRAPTVFLSGDSPGDASAAANDKQGLLYYLRRAIGDDEAGAAASSGVQFNPSSLPPVQPDDPSAPLLVIGGRLPADRLEAAASFIAAGGAALLVAVDEETAAMLPRLAGMADGAASGAAEAQVNKYALLGEIDFQHPLFAPFADPRFGDFSGIHFWRYRRISPDQWQGASGARVLARFDRGDPALLEFQPGEGRLWALLSSWRPADSELARSSKFVPLLWGMITSRETAEDRRTSFVVDQSVPLGSKAGGGALVRLPSGDEWTSPSGVDRFDKTDAPGVYRVFASGRERRFAVNLAADESRTAPLPVDQLESRGVLLTGAEIERKAAEHKRQLLDMELEGRQQGWRWLLAAALAALLAETVVAGRAARAAARAPAA